MGQNRSDSGPQKSAKRRAAERSRCPKCGRGSALHRSVDSWDEPGGVRVLITIVECRWRNSGKCDYQATTETRVDLTPDATTP